MENMGEWEQNNLINELAQGKELTKQLQIHLNVPYSTKEAREMLLQKILSSYEKALSMLNPSTSSAGDQPQPSTATGALAIESPPHSLSGSPRSEDSDGQDPKDVSKKRKSTVPRWTQQVRVSPGTGLEGPLDDGFSWRKYGQKDILGAKYPRGYYRCTHRNGQGCLATKQVQRSDEDPMIFEITYRGRHTCSQTSKTNTPAVPSQPQNQEPIINIQSEQALLNLRTSLKVVTEDLDIHHHNQQLSFPSSSTFQYFPSTSRSDQTQQQQQQQVTFSPTAMMNNNNFTAGNFSSNSFISPATSGTNYFSGSPSGFQGNQNFQSCGQSQLSEIISAAAATSSTTNSPTVGLGFPFENAAEFDPNFTFDGLFSSFPPFKK